MKHAFYFAIGFAFELMIASPFAAGAAEFPWDLSAWLRGVPTESPFRWGTTYEQCPPGQHAGRVLQSGVLQLTGGFLRPGQTEFPYPELPDPAPPYVNSQGQVEIYGSARYFIRYANWDEFERAGCYEIKPLNLFNPGYSPFSLPYGHAWDVRKFEMRRDGVSPTTVLVGGSMTPTHGRPQAEWPEDNVNRRIYFFRPDAGGDDARWVRDELPIIGRIDTGWLGHSYGGNLIQEDEAEAGVLRPGSSRPIAFFYEKVSAGTPSGPVRTELFAARMKDADHVEPASERRIFTLGDRPYPSTHRSIGGYLAEGPRPLQVTVEGHTFFLVGFSSGDFCTDGYTINFLWSNRLMGPYHPFLNRDGSGDLRDFGVELKAKFGLSWVGRPALFRAPDGSYEMLFHGVSKAIFPDHDYSRWPTDMPLWKFFRSVFKSKVRISYARGREPTLDAAIEH